MKHTLKLYKITEFDNEGGFMIYVKCKINHKKANLIVDTGATRTIINLDSCKKLMISSKDENGDNIRIETKGIGSNNLTSVPITIDEITLNRLHIKNADAFATDLSDSVDVLKDKAHIDGIMGSDILNQYSSVIDYGKCVIRFVNET